MIAPKEAWTRFLDAESKLEYMIDHGLIAASAIHSKTLIYNGFYVAEPTPCILLGYKSENVSVISINGKLHCINVDYLAEMQAGFASSLAPEIYIVLDVETTGLSRKKDKIIEIAAAKYENGEEVETFEALVNPCKVIPLEVSSLTGITNEAVQNEPEICKVLPLLMDFLGNLPVVAHNAPFDKSFIENACKEHGYVLANKFIDTLKLAQKAFPDLHSYKLKELNETLNLESKPSHRALPDVYTTAELYTKCNEQLRKMQAEKIRADIAAETEAVQGEKEPETHLPEKASTKKESNRKARSYNNIKPASILPTKEIDESNPLFEKNIVFTGELKISRSEAMQIAVNCGATVKTSVSRKTDYLVVGIQDKTLVGDDGLSTKEEHAYALNKEGKANVVFINEEQFLQLACGEVTV